MKKVMLHVSINMLLVTSAIVYPCHYTTDRGTSSSSDSTTDSDSGSGSNSPFISRYSSPKPSRKKTDYSVSLTKMSAVHLNVSSNLRSAEHDQIIYSRDSSPGVSPNLNRNSKEQPFDVEALNKALDSQKKREQIRKNCGHLIYSDEQAAEEGLQLLKTVFSNPETPATSPGNRSPMREQSETPQIKIIPASGNGTPQPITSPSSPQKNILNDPFIEKILDDVDASPNGAPQQEQLDELLEELQNPNISVDNQKKTTASTDQEVSELKKNANEAWKEKIRAINARKKLMKEKQQNVTPPTKRSYRVVGRLCVALVIAVAIFYARKLLCQTTEQTSSFPAA